MLQDHTLPFKGRKRSDKFHSQAPQKRRKLRALIDSDSDDDSVVLSTKFSTLRSSLSESSPDAPTIRKKKRKLVHVTFEDVAANPDNMSIPEAPNSDGVNPDGAHLDDPILTLSDSEAPPKPGK